MTQEIGESQAQLKIERNQPKGATHPLVNQSQLDRATEMMGTTQEMVSLAAYLKDIAGKPRGNATGGKEDLNSHFEEFIVREGGEIQIVSLQDLQDKLTSAGVAIQILGVESIGNPNQKINAVVHGVNRENPRSGYERPVTAEGPHMILAPYAIDKNGEIHLFRTIQYRTGEAVIDTPRGFADQQSLESGKQMYDVEGAGEKVKANMTRIVGEEAGKRLLKIKQVIYLGAPRVNTSFVTSRSALFGVEVDYDSFVEHNKVVSDEEFARRREQLEHEGLMGVILDMNLTEYVNYKRDSHISRDMAADSGTDTVVIDFLAYKLSAATEVISERKRMLKTFTEVFKRLKQENPSAYKKAWEDTLSDLNIKS